MVAYAQALQFWVEKANLTTQSQPCLLVGSVLELREVMKCYISFPNDAVLVVWPFQRNPWLPSFRKLFLRAPSQHLPTPPLRRLLWRLLKRRQPPLQDLQRSPVLLRSWTRSQPEGNIHQINSLGGGKCYIPPGQSLLLGRSLWSPKVPNGDLIAKVPGKGWPDAKGQRNRFKTQGQSPHCQQGCWKPCSKWYHLQASRE